ncbi:HlyD family type I secretion periplasmic adaptor subunit [Tabrizicola sp.]|uniref:HlyD family type I secretion periplasmic adaptor subunit n=1 Tax=Tabrizicola sp. TaxID=2005166 RepID=UPI0025F30603|nr:HlyD family type I secretion periplasmic adaptor subunit [Tabrizicola sp.]
MSSSDAQWSAARPLIWGFLTLGLLVGGLGAWSALTTLAGAIIAPGQIEVSQNRQIVQHPDGGVIEEIMVREGAEVLAGDVLMRLDGSALNSELVIVENQLLELAARQARLVAQSDANAAVRFPEKLLSTAALRADVAEMLAGQQSLFANQAKMMAQAQEQRQTRIGQIESQIEGFAAQQDAIRAQTGLLDKELGTQRELLAKGLTQSARVSALERELAQLKGQLGELTSARAEAAGRITEIEIEITALLTQQEEQAQAELRDLVASQSELEEHERALLERIARLDVRSPASGLVLGMQVTTPQAVIRPADALMFIVPQDRPLLVAARVPVTHVDEVHSGQDVRLVFSSLPSRTTPEVVGQVTLVSADALTDDRSGMSYFRTEVAIDAAALRQLRDVDIVPGMPVDVFIRTTDRTPLSYLLKPFTDYFRTAFRET